MEATVNVELSCGALGLSSKSLGSTHTIALAGELDLANVGTFAGLVQDARTAGADVIVVDLEALEFIDSSGIACLVQLHKELNGSDEGASLRLVASRAEAVRKVIALTGLDRRLPFIGEGSPPSEFRHPPLLST